jgi:hypothetical protein
MLIEQQGQLSVDIGRLHVGEMKNSSPTYEVLGPWAEADPIPLKGISPRVPDLAGKTIGLFASSKPAAPRMMTVLEQKMRQRFPSSRISRYDAREGFVVLQMIGRDKLRFEEWAKGVDAIVAAVGD